MSNFSNIAAQFEFTPLYENADRYGSLEWAYCRGYEHLTMIITVSFSRNSIGLAALESFAGISTDGGFTREPVRRTSSADWELAYILEKEPEVAQMLLQPAAERALWLAQRAHESAREGHTQLFDHGYVVTRLPSDAQRSQANSE